MGVGVSLSGLAAAVANEGGIGVISATGLSLLYAKASDSFVEAGGIYTGEDMYRILEMGTSLLSSNVSKEPLYAERYVLFYVTGFQYIPFCSYGITRK